MFFLTHLLANLLRPLTVVCVLLVAGLVALRRRDRGRTGVLLVGAATVVLLFTATSPFAARSIIRAERRFARFDPQALSGEERARVRQVVVLGSGHSSDPALPLSSQLGGAALSRIAEAVVILRQLPEAGLIVTGGRIYDPRPHAELLRDMAVALGIGAERIVADPGPMSTREEVAAVGKLVGAGPFVLVTSATHMPRAVGMFREAGMHPIPAPTDHSRPPHGFDLDALFPSAGRIGQFEMVEYELLGSIWQRILSLVVGSGQGQAGRGPPGR